MPSLPAGGRTLLLCDFDGTVCSLDMGNGILNHFTGAGWRGIDREYRSGAIGSREAYLRLSKILRVSEQAFRRFVQEHACLDPHFPSFHRFCRDRGLGLKIASDGLDVYIHAILGRFLLSEIEVFANQVVFAGEETLRFAFPFRSDHCGRCGTCKRDILRRQRSRYKRIVYVGDGYSDVCAAGEADLVFAKGVLRDKCQALSIPFQPFQDFADVQAHLSEETAPRP